MDRNQRRGPQHRAATLTAVVLVLVGSLVCGLWLLGMPGATRLVAESSTVRFSTGLCFLLGGASLLLALRRHSAWSLAVAVPILVLAGWTLLEYTIGRSTTPDPLFGASREFHLLARMAPNTAVALLVAALGLAALALGHWRIWALGISAMLAALTAVLGLVAALGYAFDLTVAFQWAGLTRMAFLTAVTLIVFGMGIFLGAREIGRIASWIELPWLASSVGVGAAGLGLLVTRALGGEVHGMPVRLLEVLDVAAIAFAMMLAGTVAQARHMRLMTLQLAAANRRQVEQSEEIAYSAQRLQVLIDNVQAAVVVHAGDSTIEFANPSAAELLGLTREQMLGRKAIDPIWHFVREDGSPMGVEEYPVTRVIRDGRALRDYVVGSHVAESEPIRWLLVDAVPAFGPDGGVRQVIVSFTDISERQQQKLQLEQLASTDTLTGLSTRRHLQELAGHELARARRSGRPVALIVLDVDGFKSINDRFGHGTGDRVLQRIGALLEGELRTMDLAARWGGEEFCLLLPDADADGARETAERLRAAVQDMPMSSPDGKPLQVTASFGVALSTVDDDDLRRLVDAADQAMYQAKREGRNRVCIATRTPAGAFTELQRIPTSTEFGGN